MIKLKSTLIYREKEDLVATLTKLKEQINELRDREIEATKKVKSSLEIVEQMQMEKAQVSNYFLNVIYASNK